MLLEVPVSKFEHMRNIPQHTDSRRVASTERRTRSVYDGHQILHQTHAGGFLISHGSA